MSAAPLLLLLLPVLAQEPSPAPPATPAAISNPAPAPGAEAVRVAGRDVPWPKRTKSVTPAYPPAAQAVGQRGIVIVQLLVGPDGKVAAADVVRSVPPFDEPALAAVRQWEYEVTRVDGQPVPVQLTLPITFALRLPDVAREPGVPELRQGVAPAFPARASASQPQRVTAELTLDPDGQVREAAITGGDPPFTEALLQAVRTWAFVPLASTGAASVNVEATFSAKDGPRVQLRLFGLREVAPAATASAAPRAGAPPTAAPATTEASPAPPPAAAGAPPPGPVASPPAAAPPAAAAPTSPPSPAAPVRPDIAAPPGVEVVPAPAAPPAPRPTDSTATEPGVSAVRDVTLTAGVPDLTSGRRPLVPPLARMEGVTGQVEVRFVVEASGATSNLEIAGPERLKEAARQTVSSWTFRRTSTERLFLVTTIEYSAETARAAVKRQS